MPGASVKGETGISPVRKTAKEIPGGGNTEENRAEVTAGGWAAVALPTGRGVRQVLMEWGAACGPPASPARHLSQPWSGCGEVGFALRVAAEAIRDKMLMGLHLSLLPGFCEHV